MEKEAKHRCNEGGEEAERTHEFLEDVAAMLAPARRPHLNFDHVHPHTAATPHVAVIRRQNLIDAFHDFVVTFLIAMMNK